MTLDIAIITVASFIPTLLAAALLAWVLMESGED